jgi:hypothetical protein
MSISLSNKNRSLLVLNFITISVFVFTSEWLQKTALVFLPSGIRHLLLIGLFLLNYFAYGKQIVLPFRFCVVLFILSAFLLLNLFFSPASAFNYILGVVFTFLFLFLFILGSNTVTSEKSILNIFNYLLVFIFFTSIWPIFQAVSLRTTLRWLPGVYREVGAFGSSMNTATIISLSLFIVTTRKKYIYLAVFFSVGVLMTILKKTMLSNIFVWLLFFTHYLGVKSRMRFLFYALLFIGLGLLSYGEDLIGNFEENQVYLANVGSEGHVRLGMYLASFNIANDYFPFGSGAGTFGSLASIINGYSILYYNYGVSEIGNNSAVDVANGHHTLLDTYWPHILGEFGYLGTVLFLYFWFYPLSRAFKAMKHESRMFIRALGFFIFAMIITVSWEGFTLYTPEVPVFVLLNSGLGGLCYFHLVSKKDDFVR